MEAVLLRISLRDAARRTKLCRRDMVFRGNWPLPSVSVLGAQVVANSVAGRGLEAEFTGPEEIYNEIWEEEIENDFRDADSVLEELETQDVKDARARLEEVRAKLRKKKLQRILFDEKNAPRDFMREFPEFVSFIGRPVQGSMLPLRARLESNVTQEMDRGLFSQVVSLTKQNMETPYNKAGWKMDEKEKASELEEDHSRTVIATDLQKLVGFANFRVIEEEEALVLYIYELQVHRDVSRQGLGTHLVNFMERVARFWELDWIMLTVLKTNVGARKFYERLGFRIDETSPEGEQHLILSKPL